MMMGFSWIGWWMAQERVPRVRPGCDSLSAGTESFQRLLCCPATPRLKLLTEKHHHQLPTNYQVISDREYYSFFSSTNS